MANFNDLKARFQNGDNPLEADFTALIDAIAEAGAREPSLNVSASDIRSMMSTSSLKKGALYRIPFQTKHVIPNTSVVNTGAVEYLLLYALTSSTVSRFVYSESYPQDIIALDLSDILCENGTTPRDGKITYRKDYDRNLETWYDFRNVRFRRWKVDAASNEDIAWEPSTSYDLGDFVFVWDSFYTCTKAHVSGVDFEVDMWKEGYTVDYSIFSGILSSMYRMNIPVKGGEYQDYLTFWSDSESISIAAIDSGGYNNIVIGQGSKTIHIGNNSRDMTLIGSSEVSIGNSCSDITMVSFSNNNNIGDNSSSMYINNSSNNTIGYNVQYLFLRTAHHNVIQNHVSRLSISTAFYCTVGKHAYDNEIHSDYIEIGANSEYNKIGQGSDYTKIGTNSSYNLVSYSQGTELGSGSERNELNNSSNNILGEGSLDNTLNNSSGNLLERKCSGNEFYSSNNNQLGQKSSNNTVNSSSNNYFGYECVLNDLYNASNNIIGNKCSSNEIWDSGNNFLRNFCYKNNLFDGSNFNVLGDYCSNNSFLLGSSSNQLGIKCSKNTFREGADYNVLLNECNENNVYSSFRNFLGFRCSNNSFSSTINTSEGNVLGSNCSYNIFDDANEFNRLGNSCNYNKFGGGASYNELSNNCSNNTFYYTGPGWEGPLTGDYSNNFLAPDCSYNYILGNHVSFSVGSKNNKLAHGSSCIHFSPCVSNVEFVEPQNDLRFEVSGDIDKVFDGTYPNATVSKVSPDGSLWYETIDNSGVVTLHKLEEYEEEPEPTGPTLLQTIKIDLGTSATETDTTWNYVKTNYTSGSPFALNNITGASSGCVVFPVSFAINGSTGSSPDSGTGYSIPTDIMKSYFYVTSPNARNMTFKGDANKVYDIIIFGGRATSGSTAPKGTIYTIGGVAKNLECYGNTSNTVNFDKVVPDGSGQIVINVAADTTGGNTTGYINAVIVKEYSV